jgi:hypothetical protein
VARQQIDGLVGVSSPAVPRLLVSRSLISVEGPESQPETTRAVLALAVERGRVGIMAVGEDERKLLTRVTERVAAAPRRGIAGQILAAAAARLDTRAREPRIVHPGEEPWWDTKWHDPYSMRHGNPGRGHEILVIEPLSEVSFSPHLIRGLLFYVLWTSRWTRDKTWPAFRRPTLQLEVSDDLRGRDYEEVVDQLRSLWGASRVVLPPGRPVSPLPVTPLQIIYRASRIAFWFALALSLALIKPGSDPPMAAVVAAAVAAVAIIARRVSKARLDVELSRRTAAKG